MENIIPIDHQEVVFSSSNPQVGKQISKLEKQGSCEK